MMMYSELLQQKRIIAETRKQLDKQEKEIDWQLAYLDEQCRRRRERDKMDNALYLHNT